MASPATEPVACLRHRDTQTMLRCGKCGDPICPKCMIQAPVGVRCPSCVTYEYNPLAQVRTPFLLRGVGAGIGTAIAAGVVLGIFLPLFGFFTLIIWAGAGYLIGQAVSAAANKSRARPLMYVSGGSALLAFAIATAFNPFITIFTLIAAVLAVITAATSA